MRWSFGVDPLPQTITVARRLRRITELVLSLEGEEAEVDRLIAELEGAESALAALAPPDPTPRVGTAASSLGRVYLDHARDIGAFNPSFPEYDIVVDAHHASGSVTFPIAYEGPPGIVHGGFLAVFFDCVFQHHNCDVGVTGKTTSLSMRYRRPVPLLRELTFTVERSHEDARIHSVGSLSTHDELLCTSEMNAVAGDRTALPAVSPRRTGR